MNEALLRQEQSLAEKSFSTAADYQMVAFLMKFPEVVEGKTILDLGAGASETVIELQKRGANAIAVDYRYQNLNSLQLSIDQQLQKMRRRAIPGQPDYQQKTNLARQAFFESRDKQLITAIAGALPFKDNSVDIVYSIESVIPFLINNNEVFTNAIQEALRVLKPKGQLRLFPWNFDNINGQKLTRYLREQETGYRIEPVHALVSPRFVVTKT